MKINKIIIIITSILISCNSTTEKINENQKENNTDTIEKVVDVENNIKKIIEIDSLSVPVKKDSIKSSQTVDVVNHHSDVSFILQESEKQFFLIQAISDTTIFGLKGTRIFIPADCFANENGKSPQKSIRIELKEYYSKSDIVLANLSTDSDDGLLETGGMIYINAFSNNEKLILKSGKKLILHFPKNGKTKEMKLFYGEEQEDNVVNWKESNEKLISLNRYTLGMTTRGYLEKMLIKMDSVYKNDTLKGDFPIFYFIRQNLKWNTENLKMFENRSKENPVEYTYRINSRGKIDKLKVVNGLNKDFDQYFFGIIREFNNLYSRKSNWKELEPQKIYLIPGFTSLIELNEGYINSFKKKYEKYEEKPIENIEKAELEYYIISSSKLGWINCDRFLENSNNKILVSIPIEKRNTNIKLIFKDIRSIMQGRIEKHKVVFNFIPENMDVFIFATKYVRGKPLFCFVESKVKNISNVTLEYKKMTINELQRNLDEMMN